MCTVLQVPWCFHCVKLDPPGFQQEMSLLADTELTKASSITLIPSGVLGARCISSIAYCQDHGEVCRRVALHWAHDYLRVSHHLTPATISAVVQHLIVNKDWKTYHFNDAMMPDHEDRATLDRTAAQLRTPQDVQGLDYSRHGVFLVECAQAQCEEHLAEDLRAQVMNKILTAIASQDESMSELVIDAFILHARANACSAAGDV